MENEREREGDGKKTFPTLSAVSIAVFAVIGV